MIQSCLETASTSPPAPTSAVPAWSLRRSSPSGQPITTHGSSSAGIRSIRAVIRASSGSPRPGPPTAYAPEQSIAAQTTSGETSRAVQRAATIPSQGRGWMPRPSPSARAPHEKHSPNASVPQPAGSSSSAPARASNEGAAGGTRPGSPGRASATSASPSRSSRRSPSRATSSGVSNGGGSRSVTSAGAAERGRDEARCVATVGGVQRPAIAALDGEGTIAHAGRVTFATMSRKHVLCRSQPVRTRMAP